MCGGGGDGEEEGNCITSCASWYHINRHKLELSGQSGLTEKMRPEEWPVGKYVVHLLD